MAAGGELHAEFGGDDAGAAVSGVASDADAHRKVCGSAWVKLQSRQLVKLRFFASRSESGYSD
jgi:hypothetical protein